MFAPLLSTKLNKPQARANLVPRPRLMEKLTDGLARRLALVSAPPGFGKTTLVVEWLQSLDRSSAWFSLDEGDNDAARFFAYLVAALQTIEPALGQGVQSSLDAPQLPPVDALVTLLVNDLAGMAQEAILILDDYHLIRSETIHQALGFLVEHQPANLHLVLVTREDPPLPLPKLRARGEITEIREGDLRFSLEETAAFLAESMGLELSPEAIAGLAERTEGWIAGLQMAALALQATASLQGRQDAEEFIATFRGDDRYVMDYLMEEVFRRQPREIQEFLLRTSILDRLCASLCDQVMGDRESQNGALASPIRRGSSQEILEYLDRANLFLLPLDNKREWYRFHRLFADLLRYRLERQSPEQLPELHRRACLWFKQAGEGEEAMKHALAIPDHDLAASLAEEYLLHLIGGSRVATYLRWLQSIPNEVIGSRAYLCAGYGWVHVLHTWQTGLAEQYASAGEAALSRYKPVYSTPEERWITSEEVRGHLMAIRAHSARMLGEFPRAIELSSQALEELPDAASVVRCVLYLNLGLLHMGNGDLEMARKACVEAVKTALRSPQNLNVALSALSVLAGISVWRGKLNEAAGYCHRAIRLGTVEPGRAISNPAIGYAHGWLVAVHLQRNEMDAAESYLEKALELVERMGARENIIYAYLYRARLAIDRGDIRQAGVRLQEMEAMIRDHPIGDNNQTEWVVNRGKLFLAQGEISAAVRWLDSQGVKASDLTDEPMLNDDRLRSLRNRLPEYLLLARVLLAQGDLERADRLLEKVGTIAEAVQNFEVVLESIVFQAMATYRRGDQAGALQHLEGALQLAAPEGHVRPFLHAGGPLVKLLRQAIVHGDLPGVQLAFAQKLLSELADQERRQISFQLPSPGMEPATPRSTRLVEPLTGRERQVLRLLAAGLSSTELADELVISVSTARSYIKSIYRKLDAHSRKEAIEKGAHFGLI